LKVTKEYVYPRPDQVAVSSNLYQVPFVRRVKIGRHSDRQQDVQMSILWQGRAAFTVYNPMGQPQSGAHPSNAGPIHRTLFPSQDRGFRYPEKRTFASYIVAQAHLNAVITLTLRNETGGIHEANSVGSLGSSIVVGKTIRTEATVLPTLNDASEDTDKSGNYH
jgi:hypothetical protein